MFNRPIDEFKGEAVVLGCSHKNPTCSKRGAFHPENLFYTIDLAEEMKADCILDIEHPLLENLKNKFKFTLLEHLPYSAYNHRLHMRRMNKKTYLLMNNFYSTAEESFHPGFSNVLSMTMTDGFIVILGCPPQKEFRSELAKRNPKYLEFGPNNDHVLIPKNQALSLDEVKAQIKLLQIYFNPILSPKEQEQLVFCNQAFEDMLCLPEIGGHQVTLAELVKETDKPVLSEVKEEPRPLLLEITKKADAALNEVIHKYASNPLYENHLSSIAAFHREAKVILYRYNTLLASRQAATAILNKCDTHPPSRENSAYSKAIAAEISKAATKHFEHRHFSWRLAADVILALTVVGLLVVGTVRTTLLQRSFFLCQEKTRRQREVEETVSTVYLSR